MTRRHHRVGPGVFDQPWTDDMRLVAVYLMTCKHRVTEGLFRFPKGYGPVDMNGQRAPWDRERFDDAFERLREDGFIEYDEDAEVLWLVNALKWQVPANPNQVTAAVRALDELPETPLLQRFLAVAATGPERFVEALRNRFGTVGAGALQPVANTPSPSPTPAPSPTPSPPPPLTAAGEGQAAKDLNLVVRILRGAPRLVFDPDCVGVASMLAAHPTLDRSMWAHTAAARAADPAWRTSSAAKTLEYVARDLLKANVGKTTAQPAPNRKGDPGTDADIADALRLRAAKEFSS